MKHTQSRAVCCEVHHRTSINLNLLLCHHHIRSREEGQKFSATSSRRADAAHRECRQLSIDAAIPPLAHIVIVLVGVRLLHIIHKVTCMQVCSYYRWLHPFALQLSPKRQGRLFCHCAAGLLSVTVVLCLNRCSQRSMHARRSHHPQS